MDIFNNSKSILSQINQHNVINKTLDKKSGFLSTISNQLVYQTLILKENYKYWNNVNNSWVAKIIYSFQVFPFKVYDYLQRISLSDIGSLKRPNFWKSINQDIQYHLTEISSELNQKYELLGMVMENSETLRDMSQFQIKNYQPSWWVRNWFVAGALLLFGPIVSLKLNANKYKIIDWVNENLVSILKGFYENWIISPIKECISIIKQDENIIMSRDALNSDLNSLERMVTDFLKDSNIEVPSNIHDQVVSGDLTSLMSQYETELKSPIKNLFKGQLVRSLLIQIQKTKVDGDVAISGIDKLIKSQQLLLGIVSVSPSLVIVYLVFQYLTKPNFIVRGKNLKLSCLNNLVNLKPPNTFKSKGILLIDIINLKIESKLILKSSVFSLFQKDLDRLLDGEDVLNKIYSIYSPYFT